ncbi:MAG: hypothetical protein KAI24_10835 [Planctomycetes bacterium]|nr:hypothetical protein [Planctomycetota bacterium]
MDLFDLSPEARSTITAACAAEGVDESYASFVAQHLDAADDTWRWCCSSNCDPCVSALGRAVDRARRELGLGPPGLSDGDRAP